MCEKIYCWGKRVKKYVSRPFLERDVYGTESVDTRSFYSTLGLASPSNFFCVTNFSFDYSESVMLTLLDVRPFGG